MRDYQTFEEGDPQRERELLGYSIAKVSVKWRFKNWYN